VLEIGMYDEEAKVNPLTPSSKTNWLKTSALIYLKNIIAFALILLHTVKKLLTILYFLFLKIYKHGLFKNMLSNNFDCFSLMSQ
jgi:hypothetical protein